MSHRLQVLLDPGEFSLVKKTAAREGKSLSEWVRELIRVHIQKKKKVSSFDPIEAFRKLEVPAPPIDQLLEEIERGRW